MRTRMLLLLALAIVGVTCTIYGTTRSEAPGDARPLAIARTEAALGTSATQKDDTVDAPSDPSGSEVSCASVEGQLTQSVTEKTLERAAALEAAGVEYILTLDEMFNVVFSLSPAQMEAIEQAEQTGPGSAPASDPTGEHWFFDVAGIYFDWDFASGDEETRDYQANRLEGVTDALTEAGVDFTTQNRGQIETLTNETLRSPEVVDVLNQLHVSESCGDPFEDQGGELVPGGPVVAGTEN